jgi:hypothetical protein
LSAVERRLMGDLQRFKQFIEHRDYRAGAWRGEVQQAFARM